jgi:hypothetical protein
MSGFNSDIIVPSFSSAFSGLVGDGSIALLGAGIAYQRRFPLTVLDLILGVGRDTGCCLLSLYLINCCKML